MPSETACTNEIKIRALFNRLQDTAGLAVEALEGSPSELMRRGYAWVLLKYDLKVVKRLPSMDEDIVVETRHTPGDGFHTLRAFRVFNETNEAETLVLAKTSWVLIDLAAGRPVRAGQHLPEVFSDVTDAPPIDPDFIAIPKLSGPKLKNEPILHQTSFPVRFHDLDANGHVNNAVYFEWVYEATPLDLLGWSLREVHGEFRVSVKFGETVLVRVKEIREIGEIQERGEERGKQVFSEEEEEKEEGVKNAPSCRSFVYDMVETEDSPERSMARFYAVWAPFGADKENA
jgi:medium-chain acyl-[acyl-carrier-protein] hydrolase